MSILEGRHILLGITGGIAAYKSPGIVRRLREQGAEVRVVMTPSAGKLVSATVFQAVSGNPVHTDLWDAQAQAAMGHIELARWADLVVIAPATANVMAQLASGRADNLLTTICLATRAPLFVAPAMNQAMWRHSATRNNLGLLVSRDIRIIGPAQGEQACGDTGPGRMVEPVEIVARLRRDSGIMNAGLLEGVRLLVTAGPTREPIDPVRFVSNRSSGKMGFAMAQAAAGAGARVVLIAGPVSVPAPQDVERIDVETAAEMYAAAMERIADTDIFIAAAAVADYRPATVSARKIKKKTASMSLDMVRVKDILAAAAALHNGPFTVGFAAETEHLERHAQEKLVSKQLDMIVANLVGGGRAFDQDHNVVCVLSHDGQHEFEELPKTELARRLIGLIAARYAKTRNVPAPLHQPAASK